MQNTEPMHARHGVGDVERDRQDAVERQWRLTPEQRCERSAFGERHHDVGGPLMFERRAYLDDVRMIQLAQHLRFALKAIERAGMTLGNVGAQRLDRHRPAGLTVVSAQDDPHAALTD